MNEHKSNTAIEDLMQHADETSSLSRKKSEIEKLRIDRQYDQLKKSQGDLERLAKVDVTTVNLDFADKMDREHDLMRQSLKNRMQFVNVQLTELVPFSFPNLILIGAKTGHGKSTFLANIAYPLILAKKRVFVISNEEMSVNVYNRVACLHRGYNINRFQSFTDEMHDDIKDVRRKLYEGNRLRVIDSDFPDMKDATTSLEGLNFILDKLLEEQEKNGGKATYDTVLIDYYQKIDSSKENPKMASWEVLKKVSDMLDNFYKKYHAPVVIFAQLKPEDTEDQNVEYRIKGGKNIYVSSTYCMELRPIKEQRLTEFIVHKHRFSDRVSSVLQLGHENGKYITYTQEFKVKVATENADREHREMMGKVIKENKGDGQS
jgi:KaiC/GvpD/RAD55 family RecA-like ATPase